MICVFAGNRGGECEIRRGKILLFDLTLFSRENETKEKIFAGIRGKRTWVEAVHVQLDSGEGRT